MLRLLKFELYKIYTQKSIYILFALMMGFILLASVADRSEEQSSYEEYQKWEGKITEEKIAKLENHHHDIEQKMDNNGTMTDRERNLYSISEIISYRTYKTEEREQEVSALSEIIQDASLGYEKREAELKKDMLSSIDTSDFYYQKGPANMMDFIYTFGFVITAFLTVIGISPIFSREYSTGMDQFLLSSKYGRSKAITAKLLAAIIFIMSVVLVWSLYSFTFSFYIFGMHGWNSSLQSIYAFIESPYPYNLVKSFALMMAVHILAALAFGLMTVFISAVSKRVLVSLLASGLIFGIPFAFEAILESEYPDQKWLYQLLDFSIYRFLKVKELFIGFQSFNFFGFPILYPIVAVTFSILIGILSWCLTKWLLKRKQVTV